MAKKTLLVGLIIFGIIAVIVLTVQKPSPPEEVLEKELNLYNWENYLSPEVIKDFEEKFGVKVTLDTYEDSDIMFSTIQSSPDKYDLFVAEDSNVLAMKGLKLLSPLDHQKIPNLKNLKKEAQENFYDRGNVYCVPYVSGYTGIAINTKYVKDYDLTRKVLFDEKYKGKISMLNNSIEVLMNAFFYLGFSPDDLSRERLDKARELALEQKDLVMGYDDPITQDELLDNEEAWIAYIYTSEIPARQEKNPDIVFFAPKEGVLLWADNWCISKDAPHKNAAHAFLNYLLEPEISAKNSQDMGSLMLNQEMEKFLSEEFLTATKGLDFPPDRETFLKSSYSPGLTSEEARIVSNQLRSELGVIEEE